MSKKRHRKPKTVKVESGAAMPVPPPRRVAAVRVLWMVPLLVLVACFLLFLRNSWVRVSYPYPLENGEGMCLRWACLLAKGESVYPPLSGSLPFIGCNYPPGFLWLAAAFVSPNAPSFLPLRAISLVSILALGLAVYGIARRLGASRFGAAFGALLLFTLPYVNRTGVLGRVDWMAAALALGGLWFVWPRDSAAQTRRETLRYLLGFLLFALAVLTKQTMVWAPAAWALWMLMDRWRDWPRVLALLGVGVVIHGTVLGIEGRDYLRWIGPYSSGRYSWPLLQAGAKAALGEHLFVLVPVIALGIWMVRSGQRAGTAPSEGPVREGVRLYAVALLITLLSLFFLGRRGASLHYCIHFTALWSVLAGVVVSRCRENTSLPLRMSVTWAVLFLLALVATGAVNRAALTRWERPDNTYFAIQDRKMIRIVGSMPGPVVTEDLAYTVLAGKPPYLENPFLYSDLARRGLLDPAPLLQDLREGRVSCVCLGTPITNPNSITRDRFADPFLTAVRGHYPSERKIGLQYLYFPTDKDRDAALAE